jgi:hypothetical protein
MRRPFLLAFFGVMAGVLAGCPIYSGDGNGPGPTGCEGERCGTTTTQPGCSEPSDCGQNETCGADQQCHSGDCTFAWGCVSGYVCVVDPTTQTAGCRPGSTGTGGAGTGGSATGGAGTGGAATGGAATGGAGTGGAATGGAGTGGAATGGAGTGGSAPAGCGIDGTQGLCAAGSICLHNKCWDACDPNDPTECLGQILDTCAEASTDGMTVYHVCGQSPPGTECDPTVTALACPNGDVCIGGYCE